MKSIVINYQLTKPDEKTESMITVRVTDETAWLLEGYDRGVRSADTNRAFKNADMLCTYLAALAGYDSGEYMSSRPAWQVPKEARP